MLRKTVPKKRPSNRKSRTATTAYVKSTLKASRFIFEDLYDPVPGGNFEEDLYYKQEQVHGESCK